MYCLLLGDIATGDITSVWKPAKRQRLLNQKVFLIRDNARPYGAQLIQMALKDFHWEQFEHHPYSPHLVLSDYHPFPRLKKELGGQHFQTQELILNCHEYLHEIGGRFLSWKDKEVSHSVQ